MSTKSSSPHSHQERLSLNFARFFSTNAALYFGLGIVFLWLISWFGEKKWHDVLLEAVAIMSFLTIFSFQRSQNKDVKAIQIKLDELLASSSDASNRFIKAEEAPEHILDQVHEAYKDIARNSTDVESRGVAVGMAKAEILMEEFHLHSLESESEDDKKT